MKQPQPFFARRTPRSLGRWARAVSTAALGLLVFSACDDKSIFVPTAVTISVTPNPQTLAVGATQQFTATGKDESGASVTITPVWSAVAGGGTVSSTGMFTAGTVPGTYTNTVKATSGGNSGTATIIVIAGPLATIEVTPNPGTTAVTGTLQYTAVGKDAAGNVVPITPTWSLAAGGGTVSSSGAFTAGTVPGTFTNTVRATSGTISGTATAIVVAGPVVSIAVTPNPVTLTTNATQQFTATGADAFGNPVVISATWSIVNGGGAINATSGLFTAGAVAGAFANTVRATNGTVSGTATVNVVLPLATITVTPNPANLAPNAVQQFTAVGRDANGGIVPITPVWTLANGGGTIVSGTGLFTAGAAGGTFANTVTASVGTISGTATVNIALPVATITVTPNPANLLTGGAQQFTAVGRDVNGAIVTIVPVWTVTNGGGAINSVTGAFTAGGVAGTYSNTVRATSGTVFGSATVVVSNQVQAPLIPLGAAQFNGIMAGTAVTCVTGGIINANVAISPGNTLTGFGPCVINGVTHLGDAVAAQAQIDLTTAYNQLAGLPCPPANAIVADLGGTTKAAGVYCSATSIGVTGTLTLNGGGDPNARFVFQAGTALTTAGSIVLINGAQAQNVYWQVGSSATIGTASAWQGNIIALTSITLVDTATLKGRALARNGAVTLGTGNIIILP